jgi:uncharacterized membrane protein
MADALDLPATPGRMRVVVEAAGLSDEAAGRSFAIAGASPASEAWRRFLAAALLMLGAGLVLAGIISFFAFNWASLGKFAKFGLLEAGVAGCAALGLWRRDTISGRVAMFAAAVLVGPLLGVFGQTYQTGADPWGLFAAWAILILPWVIAAAFTPLWVLEVALGDLALVLFWDQVLDPGPGTWMYLFPLLAGIHILAVAVWEAQWHWRQPTPWLTALWAPRLAIATAFGFLLAPATAFAIDFTPNSPARTFGFYALWLAVAAAIGVYRYVREDLFMLTVAGGSVLIMITIGLGRFLFEEMKLEMGGAFLMALFVIAEVVVAVSWLRRSVRAEVE